MNEGIIAVFIPIVFAIVAGLILVTHLYLRSREKQMLIDKGLSAENIKAFYEGKKDPNFMLKVGIVCVAFGIGLGLGLILEDLTSKEYYVPMMIFIITGIGFITASLIAKKMETVVK